MTSTTTIPADFPVRELGPDDPAMDRFTCGTCGRSWDDSIPTSYTPAPSARCPFEYFHESDDEDERQQPPITLKAGQGYGEILGPNGFKLQVSHPMGVHGDKWTALRDEVVMRVNQHDELVAALRELTSAGIEHLEDSACKVAPRVYEALNNARAALARVEGESR